MLPMNEIMSLYLKNNLFNRNVTRAMQFRKFRLSAWVMNSEKNKINESEKSTVGEKRDPAPHFFNPKVQEIMRRLTGLNLNKVFSTEPRPLQYENPTYTFMTEAQLKTAMEDAKKRAVERLQFPPMLKEREPNDEVLSYDPELQGLQKSKLVFVDITYGVSDKKRTMVVRDPDGTLRRATWEERDRMNQIYFPVNKRKLGMPRMFSSENLEEVLNEERYEFILDRACLQFEPDSSEFIKIYHRTFDHIDTRQKYDDLLSTRHYGPMLFYYAFYTSIDNILLHFIKNDKADEAADVVRLYHHLNAESSKSAASITEESTSLSMIKDYVRLDAKNRPQLELAVQTYEELQKSEQQYRDSVKKAHGQT